MPIEREFKYLLPNSTEIEKTARKQAKGIRYIEQGYFDKGGRIRRVTRMTKAGKSIGLPKHYFTYKHDLKDKSGVMEIETEIASADFLRLWVDVGFRLTKFRYDIPYEDHTWEVDCFRMLSQDTYLILAECEVHEQFGRPTNLLPLVKKNVIHEVEENDKRFNNKRLSSLDHVRELYSLYDTKL